MDSIKNLFKLKHSSEPITEGDNTENAREQARITYYQSGYGASIKASGGAVTFGVCLRNLYFAFEDLCRKQVNEQGMLKQPYKEEQEEQRTELKKRETALAIYEEQKDEINNNIEGLKFEIVNVKQTPEKYGVDISKRPKAQFYIGLLILLPITIYLFVFYISASYSAFFKDFETDSLTAAIFDADALGKAARDGWLEVIFVGTIPFVFMGMGYLIHMFQKTKGSRKLNFKLYMIVALTFVFDVILAYIIENKIHNFDRVLGDEFSIIIAITSANFWGIIFAGFLVYIIWGAVFDFVMKEHENMDKIKEFIRYKNEELSNESVKKNNIISKIENVKQEIVSINGKISELQSKIEGFIFPIKEYLHYHYQYKEGWYQAINAELALPIKEKNELMSRCDEISEKHLSQLSLKEEMDYQHLVYTKN
ncbi:ABC transporter permease [Flavobacterium litorale]|uniref:ABC transporter permease n=1 Tax=Flavobacterium litorale TaxID=2856519 RepID=A0ABX8VCA4_9FLAO|nr:ABC transporter permease [Flavobacterium litorale]QYJ68261.1 ABC transporter permease [Flavobacterium litorale]